MRALADNAPRTESTTRKPASYRPSSKAAYRIAAASQHGRTQQYRAPPRGMRPDDQFAEIIRHIDVTLHDAAPLETEALRGGSSLRRGGGFRYTISGMLWLKAFHVIAVITWFAGLFYLPRLFVYHADARDRIGIERFEIMERRLFAIMTIGAVAALESGRGDAGGRARLPRDAMAAGQAAAGAAGGRLPRGLLHADAPLRAESQHA